jgi:hypothetical protein
MPVVINHAVDQRFPTVMAITTSRFCEFTLRKWSARLNVGHTKRLPATAGGVAARGADEQAHQQEN